MLKYVFACAVLLFIISVILLIKVLMMKKAAKELAKSFKDKVQSDTNTLIDVSSSDSDMNDLAFELNTQLRILRKKRQTYSHGDAELKKAVTNISHDLRTPLTAISGYLDLLENEEKSENAEKYLEIIRNRTESMKNLTEELFRFSIVTSPENELKNEECDISALLQECIAENYTLLSEKGIEPKITLPDNKVMRLTDRNAMSRIFTNIISNAAKYSDGDLEITLSEDGEIRFTNTAKNLTNIQVQKMFDRFYTVNEARKSTGLGLSIAKTLISKMGGKIEATLEDTKLKIIIKI